MNNLIRLSCCLSLFIAFSRPMLAMAGAGALGVAAEEALIDMEELTVLVNSDSMVKQYVTEYSGPGRHETAKMLGRAADLFPLLECHLASKNLPLSLKYIPMIESGLRQKVSSYAGASGLWQFMPRTARHYGLTVTDSLDERQDIELSSGAAVAMLADLYRQFDDWRLVLSAYNCGPGRVRGAIRKAGSDEYESIKPYLPKQTQNYIAKFLAATYMANHYASFGIEPLQRSLQKTATAQYLLRIHNKRETKPQHAQCSTELNWALPSSLNAFGSVAPDVSMQMYRVLTSSMGCPSQKPLPDNHANRRFSHLLLRELPATSTPPVRSKHKHKQVLDSLFAFVRRPSLSHTFGMGQ